MTPEDHPVTPLRALLALEVCRDHPDLRADLDPMDREAFPGLPVLMALLALKVYRELLRKKAIKATKARWVFLALWDLLVPPVLLDRQVRKAIKASEVRRGRTALEVYRGLLGSKALLALLAKLVLRVTKAKEAIEAKKVHRA